MTLLPLLRPTSPLPDLPVEPLIFQFNARWPGFSSTPKDPSWDIRRLGLVKAAKASGATILLIQEMGEIEAAEFFADMGSEWGYDRAGLNVVGWRRDGEWKYANTYSLNLPSFGQMQRTLITVVLVHKSGLNIRYASTHLAAAASDLDEIDAARARYVQMGTIVDFLDDIRLPTFLGADWNSRGSDRPPLLAQAGWVYDATDVSTDAKKGIDGTATNYGAAIVSSKVVDLAGFSDHDGRLISGQVF